MDKSIRKDVARPRRFINILKEGVSTNKIVYSILG